MQKMGQRWRAKQNLQVTTWRKGMGTGGGARKKSPQQIKKETHHPKGEGREGPKLGTQNSPRLDEDRVGPRQRVACGPVWYKQGIKEEGDGTEKGVWLGPNNSPRRMRRRGAQAISSDGRQDVAQGKGTTQGCGPGQSNSPAGLGNQSPWSGEPWANHGEPGHGKSLKCPELQNGCEVSAGLRVDPEVPRSMA